MFYILAYDLLGEKPRALQRRVLTPTTTYENIDNPTIGETDLLLTSESTELNLPVNTPHRGVDRPYFFIPENMVFLKYWDRVDDRLYKIRNSLNIDGIKQELPLFQPPIDPMSIVEAIGRGGSLSQLRMSGNVQVPHYRFTFMFNKAKELVQKLNQFGGELLQVLEKKDSEALSMMQNKQEAVILTMTQDIKQAQLEEAQANLLSLEHSLEGAKQRLAHYQQLKAVDFLPEERTQLNLMIASVAAHGVAVAFNVVSVVSHAVPNITIGPFSSGSTQGGNNLGEASSAAAEASSAIAEGLSIGGEIAGMIAAHERLKQDWDLQIMTNQSDIIQIEAQIEGAKLQETIAKREIQILAKEIEHNRSVQTFLKDKFTNEQLYQWLAGKLSGLYYQTYQMAFDMAKSAEKSYQFERGVKASKTSFIEGGYWNSQQKGLLAGESLGLDLDRMEKAFIQTNQRRLEISKNISLLDLDPVAFLELKAKGVAEFSLPEAIFDYDFAGHYCRQVKTVSLTFDAPEGETVFATLTQLNHKTVLEPDTKAVKFLLNPKDKPPTTIRSNWRSPQSIVLSEVDEFEKPHGMFELKYEDDRYFPFEGTGVVSTWRLELNGKKGSYNVNEILDIVINLKYTAINGGSVFANGVKGMLKPYETNQFFDVIYYFPEAWETFLQSDGDDLVLELSQDDFLNMSSSKIMGITTNIELLDDQQGQVSFIVNDDEDLQLEDGKYTDTTGLTISSRGSFVRLTIRGNKENIQNLELVFAYKAKVN